MNKLIELGTVVEHTKANPSGAFLDGRVENNIEFCKDSGPGQSY